MGDIRTKNDRMRVAQHVEGESLAQQHFAKDADVNIIVNRHLNGPGRTRGLSSIGAGGTRQPMFGDFSSIDYQTMLNQVTDIDNMFRRLPARIRSRFRNDPHQLIRWVEDPVNFKEAVKMGLMAVPEGMAMTEEGNLVEQTDLVKEAAKKAPEAPHGAEKAPKADDEANPSFKKGEKK